MAVVLPANEGFSPAAVGAIGLIVQRLGAYPDPDGQSFRTVVLGAPLGHAPFLLPEFQPVHPPFWLPASRATRYLWGLSSQVKRLRPDVIEVHNRPGIAVRLAERFPDIPVALHLHNDPQSMRGMADPESRAGLQHLARVTTVSPYVRGRLMEGVADWATMPVVIPNCVDLAQLPPPLPATQRDRTILFAGRLVPEKGADCFTAACATALPHLPGWSAEIIGARRLRPDRGPGGYAASVHAAAGLAGLHVAGHRPHAAVLAAMARAAIVVVPSRWPEPFGLTALEAMASGAALICSSQGNLPELVRDAAVLVDPDHPEALAAAIAALGTDPARRSELGTAGLQRAQAFDLKVGVAALDRVRRAMLGL